MATNETLIPVGGRLHSVATEGHVAGADEIYDDDLEKLQSVINSETGADLTSLHGDITRIDGTIGTDSTTGTVKGRIKALETAVGDGGSVSTQINNAINTALDGLDANVSHEGEDGFTLNVVETNGIVTSISGSISTGLSNLKAEILGSGVSEDYDTLKELEDAIKAEATARGITDGRVTALEGSASELTSALNAEITRSKAQDNSHNTSISSLNTNFSTLSNNFNTLTNTTIPGIVDDLSDAITAERNRAEEAETEIAGNLTDYIASNDAALAAEEAARIEADTTEKEAREAADNALSASLNSEIVARKGKAIHSAKYIDAEGNVQANGVAQNGTININNVSNPKIVFYNGNSTPSAVCAVNVGDYFVKNDYYNKTDIDNQLATINGTAGDLGSNKANKVSGATANNFAALDANGDLKDSGKKASDFKTKQAAVSSPSANGTSIEFIDSISQDTNGVITPTKKTVTDVTASTNGSGGSSGLMTAAMAEKLNALPNNSTLSTDLDGKADKVNMTGNGAATENNFFAIDANGNLKDSGKNANSFMADGAAYTKNQTYTKTEIDNAINRVRVQAQGAIAGSYTIGQVEDRLYEKADKAGFDLTTGTSANGDNVKITLVPYAAAVNYTQDEVRAYQASLPGAILPGAQLTAEQATAVNTYLATFEIVTNYSADDTIAESHAYAYNAGLNGASDISTSTVKWNEQAEVSTTVLTSVDLTGLVNKPSSFTTNNFASYDSSTGKLADSGKGAGDFAAKSYEGRVSDLESAIGSLGDAVVKEITINDGEALTMTDGVVDIPLATSSVDGAMSTTDKAKLDGIETGAQVNTINTITLNGSSTGVSKNGTTVNIQAVTDLSNYYTKSETYSQIEINHAIHNATSVGLPIVVTAQDVDDNGVTKWQLFVTVNNNSVNIFTSPMSIPCLVMGSDLAGAYGTTNGIESFNLYGDSLTSANVVYTPFDALDEDQMYLLSGDGDNYKVVPFTGMPFIQPDFNQSNVGALDYIKNKPSQTVTLQKNGTTIGSFTSGTNGTNKTINIEESDPIFTAHPASKYISEVGGSIVVFGKSNGTNVLGNNVQYVSVESSGNIYLSSSTNGKAYYNNKEIATLEDIGNIDLLDGITKDNEGNLWKTKEDRSNPLMHPDLSTQPSILPYRFGVFPVYEILCPYVEVTTGVYDFDTHLIPTDAIVIGGNIFSHDCCESISCKWVTTSSAGATTKSLVISNIDMDFVPEYALVRYYVEQVTDYYGYTKSAFWRRKDENSDWVLVNGSGRIIILDHSVVIAKSLRDNWVSAVSPSQYSSDLSILGSVELTTDSSDVAAIVFTINGTQYRVKDGSISPIVTNY